METDDGNILAKIGDRVAITLNVTSSDGVSGNDWIVSGTSATCFEKTADGAAIDGKKIVYQAGTGTELFTLNDLKANVTETELATAIEVEGTLIKIKSADILDASKEISAPGIYMFELADAIKSISYDSSWTQDATDTSKYIYVSDYDTAGWTLAGKEISYTPATTSKTFTISGLRDDLTTDGENLPSAITISGDKVIISSSALADKSVSIESSDYSLELSGVTAPTRVLAGWTAIEDGFAYNTAYISAAGYEESGEYVPATTPTKLFELKGANTTLEGGNLNGIEVKEQNSVYTVEISAAALPTGDFEDGKEIILTPANETDCNLQLATGIINTKTVAEGGAAKLEGGKYTSTAYLA